MRRTSMLCVTVLVLAAGCDKAKEAVDSMGAAAKQAGDSIAKQASKAGEQMADQAGEVARQTSEMTAEVAETVVADGTFQVTLDSDCSMSACYAVFVPGVEGRKSLLQLRTYEPPDEPKPPAALLHAPVEAARLADLVGRTISCRLFVHDAQGAIWDNVDQPPASVTVVSLQEGKLTVKILDGSLENTQTGAVVPASGEATAVVP